jgi:hypothetical protein
MESSCSLSVHKAPPPVHILHHFLRIRFNIISPPTPRHSEWFLPLRFLNQHSVRISYLPHACYILRPAHPPWFDNSNSRVVTATIKRSGWSLFTGRLCSDCIINVRNAEQSVKSLRWRSHLSIRPHLSSLARQRGHHSYCSFRNVDALSCLEELNNLYCLANVTIRTGMMRLAGYVARMGRWEIHRKVGLQSLERNRPLCRPICRWENGITLYLKEMRLKEMGLIDLTRDRDRVNTVMNLRVTCMEENLFN